MQTNDHQIANVGKIFTLLMILTIAIVLIKAVLVSNGMDERLSTLSNDDVMRLVSVRNWLGGQEWFDTVEYRLMPPEGVLMHWSRYLDAAIAAIIVPLSWLVPMPVAEHLAVAIWPTTLMILLILCVGFGTRRILGPVAACFAMACTILWPLASDLHFRVGRLDHHNVQILLMVLMTFAAIWPTRPNAAGVVAGVAAAFSLAVGFESLPYILALGLLLLLRATFEVTDRASRLLVVFSGVLAAASVLFWVGQTPWSRLLQPVCDQLGTPVLSLIAIAGVASTAPIVLGLKKPLIRLGVSVGLALVGCVLAWPLLGPCSAGPYASLPSDVQEIISGFIAEAEPGLNVARSRPFIYNMMMTPVAGAVVLAFVIWLRDRRQPDADPVRLDVIGQLLLLSLVGLLASFSQMRLLIMATAVTPLLAGYGLSALFASYRGNKSAGAAVALMAASVVILAPYLLQTPIQQAAQSDARTFESQDADCQKYDLIAQLDAMPPAVFLTPMNIGPLIILATHHSALSGPYHRSPSAFANGLLPFQMQEPEMETYVRATGATHLMLCRGSSYGESFASSLAEGGSADWLRPVTVQAGNIMVFEILPQGGV